MIGFSPGDRPGCVPEVCSPIVAAEVAAVILNITSSASCGCWCNGFPTALLFSRRTRLVTEWKTGSSCEQDSRPLEVEVGLDPVL